MLINNPSEYVKELMQTLDLYERAFFCDKYIHLLRNEDIAEKYNLDIKQVDVIMSSMEQKISQMRYK